MPVHQIISDVSVNAILIQEDKGTHSPIYYKMLLDTETTYLHFDKLALIVVALNLRLYFNVIQFP